VAGHVYTVAMIDQTVVADATLVIIHTAAALTTRSSMISILRAGVSQHGSATSQQLGIRIGTKVTAFGTYTSTTPNPHALGGAASGIAGGTAGAAATAGTDASAEGAGTFTALIEDGFNNLNGWIWVPTPDERLLIPADTAVVLKLHGTPTTLTNWHAYVTFEEIN
jgi:hypothetical protein